MLHIILLILKIIGIVLLCIIGILLRAAACVLFVPVRYKIKAGREEGEGNPPVTVYVKATWLLHLLNILIRYPSEVIVRARIMIFTVFRLPGKEKREKKLEKISAEKKTAQKKHEEISAEPDATADDQELFAQTIRQDGEDIVFSAVPEDYTAFGGGEEDFADQEKMKESEEEEKSFFFSKIQAVFTRLRQIVEKIKGFFQNIQYTIRKICDRIKAVSDNIQYYRGILESDSFRRSFALCREELMWVLKKIKPDKFEADLVVGLADPAATGEILAVYGMLYPMVGRHVRIVGDFECERIHVEGRLYIRGKIRVFTFLRVAVRVYFNKDIKKLIRLLKKEAV